MHMSDALLSPVVGGVMAAVSIGAILYSVHTMKKNDDLVEKTIPMMGVTGAFVFAAQMLNFTLPLTGSSGHIGGGILLAAILGGSPAFLTMTAVLLIQAFLFGDGGLLALGCNIFNMGIIPCFIIYPLFAALLKKETLSKKRIFLFSMLGCILSLQLGAFSVVLETLASGVSALPFSAFVSLMQPIHFLIGIVEGLICGTVLCFIQAREPRRLQSGNWQKSTLAILLGTALIMGGMCSYLASSLPDGLEWAISGVIGDGELASAGGIYDTLASVQAQTALLADYGLNGAWFGTALSGLSGALLIFFAAILCGTLIYFVKKRKQRGV